VRIEVPRGGHVKRRPTGEVELISPLGSPFDYGSIIGVQGADGDLADAVVLGPRRRAGEEVTAAVHGVVRFLERGRIDDKWICGEAPSPQEQRRLARFFRWYASLKRVRHPGAATRVTGIAWWDGRSTTAAPPR
jgi:inorganic pyrophosphatase